MRHEMVGRDLSFNLVEFMGWQIVYELNIAQAHGISVEGCSIEEFRLQLGFENDHAPQRGL
jgi:hypothetical protein